MTTRSRSTGAAAAAASSSSAQPDSLESLESLVLDQLIAAVQELQPEWDEEHRRNFVVSVLHESLGAEPPDANHSWPTLERFSLRTLRGICTQLALEVVEGPRAKHHMLEAIQDSLWTYWDLNHSGAHPKAAAVGVSGDAMSVDGSDSPDAGAEAQMGSGEPTASPAAAPAVALSAAQATGLPAPLNSGSTSGTRASPRRKKVQPVALKAYKPSARPAAPPSSLGPSPAGGLSAAQLAAIGSLPSKPVRPAASRSKHRMSSRRLFPDTSSSSSSTGTSSASADSDQSSSSDPSDTEWTPPTPPARSKRAHRKHRSPDVSDEMESTGRAQPMAKEFIRNVLRNSGGTSIYRVFKYDVVFHSERNRRECLALSRILDAALAGDTQQLVELTVRRLAGVHTADSSDNNWDACDAIEQVMEKQSFVPTKFLQRTLRTVVQLQALQRKPKDLLQRPSSGPSHSGRGKRTAPPEPGFTSTHGASSSKKGAVPHKTGGSSGHK